MLLCLALPKKLAWPDAVEAGRQEDQNDQNETFKKQFFGDSTTVNARKHQSSRAGPGEVSSTWVILTIN